MNLLAMGRRVFEIEIDSLRLVEKKLGPSFEEAVQRLSDSVAANRKVIVVGVGKSGHVGQKIAATLASTGAPSVVLNAVDAFHGDLGIACEGDAALALSYSGETEELVRLLPYLKRMKVSVIAMTGNLKSTLAQNADTVLDVGVEKEACPHNLAPTSSTTAMLALGDALAMVLLEKRGFQKEDFARLHPGGTLGRNLLLRVGDIMRPREAIVVLPGKATVKEALRQWNRKRAGAAVVVDGGGAVEGIFTHGDFVRRYERDPQVGELPLSAVITSRPVTVRVDKLAVEVLNLFEVHRIDDLIVVDGENRPVGMVDSRDLTMHKLM